MKVSSTLLIYSGQIEVTISGDYYKAQPTSRPRYDSGGEPAEPAYMDDITATLNGEVIELTQDDEERAECALVESVEI